MRRAGARGRSIGIRTKNNSRLRASLFAPTSGKAAREERRDDVVAKETRPFLNVALGKGRSLRSGLRGELLFLFALRLGAIEHDFPDSRLTSIQTRFIDWIFSVQSHILSRSDI